LNAIVEVAALKILAAKGRTEKAGLDPPDLEPLGAEAMQRRGLARKADGIPTFKHHWTYHCSGLWLDECR
jgi:hypothetical protein